VSLDKTIQLWRTHCTCHDTKFLISKIDTFEELDTELKIRIVQNYFDMFRIKIQANRPCCVKMLSDSFSFNYKRSFGCWFAEEIKVDKKVEKNLDKVKKIAELQSARLDTTPFLRDIGLHFKDLFE
jgi:hypothetical protein